MEILRAVKGMNDLYENELVTWRHIEKFTRETCEVFGYKEIRTPILEDLSLFVRGVGEGTDIVEKEMYTLNDRDGKMLCLRPENTAGVVRAMIEHHRFAPDTENKVYYIGPLFRRERPQRGRLRQFSQLGVEAFGSASPNVDVEVITLFCDLMTKLGLSGLQLELNTLGEAHERADYVAALRSYFHQHEANLCADCHVRLHKNTLRILDCKKPSCIALTDEAPVIVDYLQDASRVHFAAVCDGLSRMNIPFVLKPRLVRGLDYYTRTVFELTATSGLGAQNTVGGGGRYDGLVQSLGGPSTPAFGFAAGVERIVLLMEDAALIQSERKPQLVIVGADQAGQERMHVLARELRQLGVFVEVDHFMRSLKAQMRRADRLMAQAVLVLGEREIISNQGQIKNMQSKAIVDTELSVDAIAQALRTL